MAPRPRKLHVLMIGRQCRAACVEIAATGGLAHDASWRNRYTARSQANFAAYNLVRTLRVSCGKQTCGRGLRPRSSVELLQPLVVVTVIGVGDASHKR
ncbi:hypothetical protein PLANPX_0203 [Lacipirellula parvula]|uniref:Uncharacterized protein n=1 Tax=Lacipirellula parvula TaxID=2650471 RepID=A0A5K7X790_9BACT|nr:hypothetical protein PLANPX_0203 [Lacipirellula parvula]